MGPTLTPEQLAYARKVLQCLPLAVDDDAVCGDIIAALEPILDRAEKMTAHYNKTPVFDFNAEDLARMAAFYNHDLARHNSTAGEICLANGIHYLCEEIKKLEDDLEYR